MTRLALLSVVLALAGCGMIFAQDIRQYIPVPIPASMIQGYQAQRSTVSGLPTCNAAAEGTILGVTDALTPVALSAVVGLGAIHVAVYCTGSSWIVL